MDLAAQGALDPAHGEAHDTLTSRGQDDTFLAKYNPAGQLAWVEQMGEWVLPYETVRGSADPEATLRQFLDCAYGLAGSLGGWDLQRFEYTRPLPSKRA